jgi:hypothetical protein
LIRSHNHSDYELSPSVAPRSRSHHNANVLRCFRPLPCTRPSLQRSEPVSRTPSTVTRSHSGSVLSRKKDRRPGCRRDFLGWVLQCARIGVNQFHPSPYMYPPRTSDRNVPSMALFEQYLVLVPNMPMVSKSTVAPSEHTCAFLTIPHTKSP